MSVHTKNSKMTVSKIRQMKQQGEKIAMLTSYDFTLTSLIDTAGIEMILVGDSASNIVCGNDYTMPITLDEMIFLARGVVRGAKGAFVVVDMPFGSYQVSVEEGVRNAIRIIKESGANAVKLEGGVEILPTIERIIQSGIPVMGHLGLTPQSVNQLGGYGLCAKETESADKLLSDAMALDKAGCFSIVLEKIPAVLAEEVTKKVACVTIGIGAGVHTDGQVLVLHDMLGLNTGFKPKFLRHFGTLADAVDKSIKEYINAVKEGSFPSIDESF